MFGNLRSLLRDRVWCILIAFPLAVGLSAAAGLYFGGPPALESQRVRCWSGEAVVLEREFPGNAFVSIGWGSMTIVDHAKKERILLTGNCMVIEKRKP